MDPSNDPKDVAGLLVHALLLFLTLAAGAAVFGVAYWMWLKKRAARKAAELEAGIARRKAEREARRTGASGDAADGKGA